MSIRNISTSSLGNGFPDYTALSSKLKFVRPSAGYWAGGSTGSRVSTVDKLSFSDNSRSTLGTGLSSSIQALNAFASITNGYAVGGNNGSFVSPIF